MYNVPQLFLSPRLNFPPRYRRTRGPGVTSLIGVDYLRLKTGDGGDLYLTRFGMPFREQLAPENWYAQDWFAVRRARLPGTSAIYKVPTRPVRGVSLNLVARFSRVGQEIPLDTLTLDENIHAEFNSPFEEFALVMELRAAGLGASRARILTKRPLAIYMPPEQLQHWQTGRLESKMAAKRARHPEAELDLLRQYILLYGWIEGLNAVQAIQALGVTGRVAETFLPRQPSTPSMIWNSLVSACWTSSRSISCCEFVPTVRCFGGALEIPPTRWWTMNYWNAFENLTDQCPS